MSAPGAAATAPGGRSWLHGISPIPKLAWLAAAVVFAFVSFQALPLALIVVAGLAVAASAGVLRAVLRALLVLAPLAASIIVIQALAPAACAGGCTEAVRLGPITIYADGVARGVVLVARVLAMEVAAFVVLETTHPSDLFAGLARLRVPYLFNFMVALTLHLVPVLEREVRIVLSAQRARGMRGTGFGALVPSLVPVFAGTFERVQRLAISLESRGFGSSGPITSYRRVGFDGRDRALAITGLVAGAAGVGWAVAAPGAAAQPPVVPEPLAAVAFAVAAAGFVGTLVAAARAISRA